MTVLLARCGCAQSAARRVSARPAGSCVGPPGRLASSSRRARRRAAPRRRRLRRSVAAGVVVGTTALRQRRRWAAVQSKFALGRRFLDCSTSRRLAGTPASQTASPAWWPADKSTQRACRRCTPPARRERSKRGCAIAASGAAHRCRTSPSRAGATRQRVRHDVRERQLRQRVHAGGSGARREQRCGKSAQRGGPARRAAALPRRRRHAGRSTRRQPEALAASCSGPAGLGN
jgi:hypothetical protein